MNSLRYIDTRLYSLVVIVVFGGVLPCVTNIKISHWMKYECKIKNYIYVPSGAETAVDYINLILVAVGFGLQIGAFGKDVDT